MYKKKVPKGMSSREYFSQGLKPLKCGNCCACCVGDIIRIHPELGDNADDYETEERYGVIMLKHTKDKKCIYLTDDNKCSNYENRPAICKEFDCRVTIKAMGFTQAKKFVANTMMQKGVVMVGLRKLREDKIK